MPNLGAVLKEEITRLSRRSTKSLYSSLKKDVVALKHAVAQLKRQIQKLGKDNAMLMADLKAKLAAPPAVSEEEARNSRISPRLIRSQRKRLDLSRDKFAKLLGVSAGSVMAWEMDKAKPRTRVKAVLAGIRKLGKREARQRLEAITSANGNGRRKIARKPSKNSRKNKRKAARTFSRL